MNMPFKSEVLILLKKMMQNKLKMDCLTRFKTCSGMRRTTWDKSRLSLPTQVPGNCRDSGERGGVGATLLSLELFTPSLIYGKNTFNFKTI